MDQIILDTFIKKPLITAREYIQKKLQKEILNREINLSNADYFSANLQGPFN